MAGTLNAAVTPTSSQVPTLALAKKLTKPIFVRCIIAGTMVFLRLLRSSLGAAATPHDPKVQGLFCIFLLPEDERSAPDPVNCALIDTLLLRLCSVLLLIVHLPSYNPNFGLIAMIIAFFFVLAMIE